MGQGESDAARDFLVVRLDGREYGVSASRLVGMQQARALHVTTSEDDGEGRLVAKVHGKDLPVIVPHPLLHLQERPVSARSCLLLVGGQREHDPTAASFALLADSISRLETVDSRDYRPETEGPYAVAQIRLGDKWRDVLDLDQLARACSGVTSTGED